MKSFRPYTSIQDIIHQLLNTPNNHNQLLHTRVITEEVTIIADTTPEDRILRGETESSNNLNYCWNRGFEITDDHTGE